MTNPCGPAIIIKTENYGKGQQISISDREKDMRVGICDDDVLWCQRAETIIRDFGVKAGTEMEICSFSGWEEVQQYTGYPLDVLFMDIVLESGEKEEENGIRLTSEINQRWKGCKVVYLTNYLCYAVDDETEHVFYVLKEQFEDKVGRVFEKILHQISQDKERLVFSVIGGKEIVLAPADIFCFERRGRVTNVYTTFGIYPIWNKLSDLVKTLPELDFVRCHNSYIVYLPAIHELHMDSLTLNSGQKIMISRGYRKQARAAFTRWACMQMS